MNTLSFGILESEQHILPTRTDFTSRTRGAEVPSPSLPDLRLRAILAPFDFSDVSTTLIHRLVKLAEAVGATLHILHVVEPTGADKNGANRGSYANSEARLESAKQQLQQWVTQTLRSEMPITSTVRVGRPADEIVAQARCVQADLIVMSAQVGIGLKNVLQRTTTERVVRLAQCPILVIARNKVNAFLPDLSSFPPKPWKRILFPVDLANSVPGALAYAASIARANDAKLHVLHAVTGNTNVTGEDATTAKNRLAEWLRGELHWPTNFEAAVWTGIPLAHAILTEASRTRADVIVLPTRDCAWSRRFRLWSITHGLLRHAPCPVLCINENFNRQTSNQ